MTSSNSSSKNRVAVKSLEYPVVLGALRLLARRLYPLRGTGLPRIAEYIRIKVAGSAARGAWPHDVWIDDFCGHLRFRCDLSEHMGSQIFFRGAYSRGQLSILRQLLKPDSVFVDAGANQGEFTVCAASLTPLGTVHAFEPMPDLVRRLRENVEANGLANVQVHCCGLSDGERCEVPIYASAAVYVDGTRNAGLPTIFPSDERDAEVGHIHLVDLDRVLGQSGVDVMKIDVEGAELAVLKGAAGVIENAHPYILFEANAETARAAGYAIEELFSWLEARDYRLRLILPDGGLMAIQRDARFGNVLAVPKSRAGEALVA
ncbi:FkbM family methyltransferase [Thiohalocapsa marina]|uniref:FkbM family methyltransferase n=1 Tax=Thiohalocapsa marina TaxID=424902 RepID=A0A5M8FU53_9GAMM|nr:FkbM family methyltransferase [Thiohalocapsa marina]KAA6187313.1 FkbM family methyltransferase [Thiohalocapsa marina]